MWGHASDSADSDSDINSNTADFVINNSLNEVLCGEVSNLSQAEEEPPTPDQDELETSNSHTCTDDGINY